MSLCEKVSYDDNWVERTIPCEIENTEGRIVREMKSNLFVIFMIFLFFFFVSLLYEIVFNAYNCTQSTYVRVDLTSRTRNE